MLCEDKTRRPSSAQSDDLPRLAFLAFPAIGWDRGTARHGAGFAVPGGADEEDQGAVSSASGGPARGSHDGVLGAGRERVRARRGVPDRDLRELQQPIAVRGRWRRVLGVGGGRQRQHRRRPVRGLRAPGAGREQRVSAAGLRRRGTTRRRSSWGSLLLASRSRSRWRRSPGSSSPCSSGPRAVLLARGPLNSRASPPANGSRGQARSGVRQIVDRLVAVSLPKTAPLPPLRHGSGAHRGRDPSRRSLAPGETDDRGAGKESGPEKRRPVLRPFFAPQGQRDPRSTPVRSQTGAAKGERAEPGRPGTRDTRSRPSGPTEAGGQRAQGLTPTSPGTTAGPLPVTGSQAANYAEPGTGPSAPSAGGMVGRGG